MNGSWKHRRIAGGAKTHGYSEQDNPKAPRLNNVLNEQFKLTATFYLVISQTMTHKGISAEKRIRFWFLFHENGSLCSSDSQKAARWLPRERLQSAITQKQPKLINEYSSFGCCSHFEKKVICNFEDFLIKIWIKYAKKKFNSSKHSHQTFSHDYHIWLFSSWLFKLLSGGLCFSLKWQNKVNKNLE